MLTESNSHSIVHLIQRYFGEGWAGAIANIFLPVAFGFVMIGPQGLTWLPGIFALCICFAMWMLGDRMDWSTMKQRLLPLLLPITVFLIWAVIRSFWTPTPEDARPAMNSFVATTCLILFSSVLVWSLKPRGLWHWVYFPLFLLVAGIILAAILAALTFGELRLTSQKRMMQVWHYNRSALFVALFWPIAIFAIRQMDVRPRIRSVFFWATTLTTAVAIFISWSESAKLAFIVILMLYGLIQLSPRFSQLLLAIGGFLSVFAVLPLIHILYSVAKPTKIHDVTESPVIGRLSIWEGLLDPIMQSPWVGHGVEFVRAKGYFNPILKQDVFPSHPHSALIQVWVDLGAIGALLLAICFAVAALQVRLVDRRVAAMYLPLIAGIITIWSVSHGMWQSWYVGLAGMMVIFAVLLHRRSVYETLS